MFFKFKYIPNNCSICIQVLTFLWYILSMFDLNSPMAKFVLEWVYLSWEIICFTRIIFKKTAISSYLDIEQDCHQKEFVRFGQIKVTYQKGNLIRQKFVKLFWYKICPRFVDILIKIPQIYMAQKMEFFCRSLKKSG